MVYSRKVYIIILGIFALAALANGQQPEPKPKTFFDSIDHRISYLQTQIDRLKQKRDVSYLNMQRELNHTLFVREYESFIVDEDLEKAKSLVESRIEYADFRRDQASSKFYRSYQDNIYSLIKLQKMHYQRLFIKEKNFRKEYEQYTASETPAAYERVLRMVLLAIKYAKENNLSETVKYLETYESYTRAHIFDFESEYDLEELTGNAKSFGSVFMPLVESDSIEGLKEAEKLLEHCRNFGSLTGSNLNGEFFKKQEMILTTAYSDMLERQGREKELSKYTDQSVIAKYDTLNPCGVFKWHDQVVVIDEFMPTSTMENVKKGEAIIHADKMLATYLQKNKLCQSVQDLKFGYSFIIPYKSKLKNSSFYFNQESRKWQYIACYTIIVSQDYTSQVSKFMPPLFFEDEMNNTASVIP